MTCRTLQGKYAEKLEKEVKRMNETIEKLYKKLDALDSIIDQQALEISQLKEQKKQAIDYIKECMETTHKINDYWTNELVNGSKLLEILGDGNNE